MIRFDEFLNSIKGYEEVTSRHGKGYDVFGEIIPGVEFTCFISESDIDPDLDLEGQLDRKAYDNFIAAIE